MGCTESRDQAKRVEGAPEEENYCFNAEYKVGLTKIDFITFQAAIKRFGYRVNLNKEHIKAISNEINLNVDILYEDANSPQALVYHDTEFAYKNEVY